MSKPRSPFGPPERLPDLRLRAACTLAEVGDLVAGVLESRRGEHPQAAVPVPALVAANRAGFVTTGWQAGGGAPVEVDGWIWTRLAAVTGLCSEATARSLCDYLGGATGVLCDTIAPPGSRRSRPGGSFAQGVWATWCENPDTREKRTPMVFGAPASRRALRSMFGGSAAAVEGAWQCTFFAAGWDRNDRLWPFLEAWAAACAPVRG